jgi:hypothetical protein
LSKTLLPIISDPCPMPLIVVGARGARCNRRNPADFLAAPDMAAEQEQTIDLAAPDRWVNFGVAGEEYRDLVRSPAPS